MALQFKGSSAYFGAGNVTQDVAMPSPLDNGDGCILFVISKDEAASISVSSTDSGWSEWNSQTSDGAVPMQIRTWVRYWSSTAQFPTVTISGAASTRSYSILCVNFVGMHATDAFTIAQQKPVGQISSLSLASGNQTFTVAGHIIFIGATADDVLVTNGEPTKWVIDYQDKTTLGSDMATLLKRLILNSAGTNDIQAANVQVPGFIDSYGGTAENYLGKMFILKAAASAVYTYTGAGGIALGGDSTETYVAGNEFAMAGGIALGGDATEVFAPGGVNEFLYSMAGGVDLSGLAEIFLVYYPVTMAGGLTVGLIGSGTDHAEHEFLKAAMIHAATGGIILGGAAGANGNQAHVASGGITFGDAGAVVQMLQAVETVAIVIPLSVAVSTAYTPPPNDAPRSIEVTINGTTLPGSNLGRVEIQHGENQERVANFRYTLPAGAFTISDYHGKTILIDEVVGAMRARLFTGLVNDFVFDYQAAALDFTCTDALLTDVEAATRAQIDALVPGAYWSPWVFDENAQGLQYLQDRLATVPVEYHYNAFRQLETANLFAKTTPDISLTDIDLIEASLSVQLANRLQYVNRYDLTFEYRFPVLRKQTGSVIFEGVDAGKHWCDGVKVILRGAITGAIERAGAEIVGDSLIPVPSSGSVTCGVTETAFFNAFYPNQIYGGSVDIERRTAITATEKYQLTVSAPQSIQVNGELPEQDQASGSVDFDASEWISGKVEKAVTGQAGVTDQADDGRAKASAAIEAMIKKAIVTIQTSHRAHTIDFSIPARADISLNQTIALDAQGVNVRGKVSEFSHIFDHESGEAMTNITLSVSKVGVAEVAESSVVAPDSPALPSFTQSITVNVPTFIDQDIETGGTGFYTSAKASEAMKPGGVKITIPGIDDAELAPVELAAGGLYACRIIENQFEVTIP